MINPREFGRLFYAQWYARLVRELGLDPRLDEEAAMLLNSSLKRALRLSALEPLRGSRVMVHGYGPSLARYLSRLKELGLSKLFVHVAADAAVRELLRHGLVPQVVVSDLDGLGEEELEQLKGSLLVVHAHGDNRDRLKALLPKIPKAIGTIQVLGKGLRRVHNLGGFTDGDRAVILSSLAGASCLVLCGMDLASAPRPKPQGDEGWEGRKARKLALARAIIDWALSYLPTSIAALGPNTGVMGIPQIDIESLDLLP